MSEMDKDVSTYTDPTSSNGFDEDAVAVENGRAFSTPGDLVAETHNGITGMEKITASWNWTSLVVVYFMYVVLRLAL